MGPLQLFPALTLRDIGIDSNVYNESVRHEDFTYTVSPTLKTVLPIRESRLTTRGALDFRYFQTHKDQQSTSGSLNTQLEVGSGRVRPFGTAGLVRSHERGGYDVDRRAYTLASQVKAGASLSLTPVTSLTGWLVRESTRFDRLEMFDGVSLSQQLDRVTRGTASGLRFELTLFTSVPRRSRSRRSASRTRRCATPTASVSRRSCSSPRAPSSKGRRRRASGISGRSIRGSPTSWTARSTC
jgi:hypothetical protein